MHGLSLQWKHSEAASALAAADNGTEFQQLIFDWLLSPAKYDEAKQNSASELYRPPLGCEVSVNFSGWWGVA
jgi:hypothetical protein